MHLKLGVLLHDHQFITVVCKNMGRAKIHVAKSRSNQ